jgi:hypothetical protein
MRCPDRVTPPGRVGGVLDSMNGRDTQSSRCLGVAFLVKAILIEYAIVCPVASLGCKRARDVQTAISVYDAGVVFADMTPVITHEFEVTNRSDRPVHIVSQAVSCVCTATNLASREMPARGSTVLRMTAPTPYTHSRQSLSCTLRTDVPVACSPKSGPVVMKVLGPWIRTRTHHEADSSQLRADHPQAA